MTPYARKALMDYHQEKETAANIAHTATIANTANETAIIDNSISTTPTPTTTTSTLISTPVNQYTPKLVSST